MAEPNTARDPGAPADPGVNRRTGAERTHTPGGAQRETRGGHESGGMVGRIKNKAATTLDSQKQRATESLGGVAEAVRNSSDQLRSKDHGVMAGYVDEAADQIDRLSRRLKEKDVRELTEDAQRFARRHPAAVVGSAFALGIATARFLKSSAEDDAHDRYENRSSGGRSASGGYRGEPTAPASTTERYRSAPGAAGTEGYRGAAGTGVTSESYRSTPGSGSTSESQRGVSGTGSTSVAGGTGASGTTPSGTTGGTGTNKRS